MDAELEQLKQQLPLLEYLQRRNWTARRGGDQPEFVGLCPLHRETHPSFYVNARKNVFFCHGCGRGGDLIRFIELSLHLSFQQSLAHLRQELTAASGSQLFERNSAFYQLAFHRHPEAVEHLSPPAPPAPRPILALRIPHPP